MTLLARLACLIHAANVHSEPGSNPSIDVCLPGLPNSQASRLTLDKSHFLEVAWLATVIKLWSLLRRLPRHLAERTKSPDAAELPTPRFSRPQSVLTELKEVTHQIVKDRFSFFGRAQSLRLRLGLRGRSPQFAASPPLSRKARRPSMGLVEFFLFGFSRRPS